MDPCPQLCSPWNLLLITVLRLHQIRTPILENLLEIGWDAIKVGGVPIEKESVAVSKSPVETGPAALFLFSSSLLSTTLGDSCILGFDWSSASQGLLLPSFQGPGPHPIWALCLLKQGMPCLYSQGH